MIKSKTSNAGPTGMKPKGNYSASATYTLLDCVNHNHDSWVCKAVNNKGDAITITGEEPTSSSQYWQALTDGGLAAFNEGETAKQKGNTAAQQGATAAEKAQLADEKAQYANTQGDYAKEWNEHPPYIADGTSAHPGDLNYMYLWDITTHDYVRGAYVKGDDLDYSTMTPEEYQKLVDDVKADLVFASQSTCEDIINELT